jgi:hypothetical protein
MPITYDPAAAPPNLGSAESKSSVSGLVLDFLIDGGCAAWDGGRAGGDAAASSTVAFVVLLE